MLPARVQIYAAIDTGVNRYYSNAYGRFMTPDPYAASGGPSDPQSWNRYAYTRGDPANRYDPHGTDDSGGGDGGDGSDPNADDNFTCDTAWESDASIFGNPCGVSAPSPWGGIMYINIAAIISAAEATALTAAQSIPHPKCWQNIGNISATFSNLGSNVEQDVSKQFSSADLALLTSDINSDTASETWSLIGGALTNTPPSSPNYIGGHFNLNLTTQQISQFSASDQQAFASDFSGTSSDGVRQDASTGLAAQLGFSLHSQLNKIPGDYSFHFDRFNPQDVIGIGGHAGWDVFRGHLGHPCLDPAWRQ